MIKSDPNKSSLIIQLNYKTYRNIDKYALVYDLLNRVEGKSKYIIRAINYYNEVKDVTSMSTREFDFFLRLRKNIINYYSLRNKDSVNVLLNLPDNSATYKQIKELKLKHKNPTIITLGFNKYEEESINCYLMLKELNPKERLIFIADAIVAFVLDNQDSGATMSLNYSFLYNLISDYRRTKNKEEFIDKTCEFLGFCQ